MKKIINSTSTFSKILNSPEETYDFASWFAGFVEPGDFVALFGEIGGGKTTFVRGFASKFNLENFVCSPTFTIINEYVAETSIVHCDFYRVKTEQDLISTGFYEYLFSNKIIIAEWCENIYGFHNSFTASINFEMLNINSRKVTVTIY